MDSSINTKDISVEDVGVLMNSKEQIDHCNALVQMSIDYCHSNPDVLLGTQLRAYAISSAIASRICDLPTENLEDAANAIVDIFVKVYSDLEGRVEPAPLQ
jgi:hypothetical protein